MENISHSWAETIQERVSSSKLSPLIKGQTTWLSSLLNLWVSSPSQDVHDVLRPNGDTITRTNMTVVEFSIETSYHKLFSLMRRERVQSLFDYKSRLNTSK